MQHRVTHHVLDLAPTSPNLPNILVETNGTMKGLHKKNIRQERRGRLPAVAIMKIDNTTTHHAHNLSYIPIPDVPVEIASTRKTWDSCTKETIGRDNIVPAVICGTDGKSKHCVEPTSIVVVALDTFHSPIGRLQYST